MWTDLMGRLLYIHSILPFYGYRWNEFKACNFKFFWMSHLTLDTLEYPGCCEVRYEQTRKRRHLSSSGWFWRRWESNQILWLIEKMGLVYHFYSIPWSDPISEACTPPYICATEIVIRTLYLRRILSSWMAIPRWYIVVRLYGKFQVAPDSKSCLDECHWKVLWIDLWNIHLWSPLP